MKKQKETPEQKRIRLARTFDPIKAASKELLDNTRPRRVIPIGPRPSGTDEIVFDRHGRTHAGKKIKWLPGE